MIRRIYVVLFMFAVSLSCAILGSQADAQTFLTHHTRDVVVHRPASWLSACISANAHRRCFAPE
jgi:hypothetical protein